MAAAVVLPEAPDDGCQCGHSHDPRTHQQHKGPAPSLAYQLWFPWSMVVLNPLPTLAIYVGLNAIFLTIGFVLGVLADVITAPGVALALVVALVVALRRVTSLLAYPGQLQLVVRDGEATFARVTRKRLLMAIDAASALAQALQSDGRSERPTRPHSEQLQFAQVHQTFVFALTSLVTPLLQSLERIEQDGLIGPHGTALLAAVRALVAFDAASIAPLCAELCSVAPNDFVAMRQQRLLRCAATGTGSVTGPIQPHAASINVAELETLIDNVRSTIQWIGRPVSETPKDAAWVLQQLCHRSTTMEIDIITTLDLMRADLATRFRGEQIWIPGDAGHQIDAMFLPAACSSSASSKRPIVIVCNPNGGLYEFHHMQMDWIQFYTVDVGCDVLLFNYRGYGRNGGAPSPKAHNLDALAIVAYLKHERNVSKIAIHGESIGGMVATFLGANSSDVDVIIADRTFANLPALAQRLVASWAGRAVRLLVQWDTDSTANYMHATCHKLLCSDASDEIIHDSASLKTGVAVRRELGDVRLDVRQPHRRAPVGSDTNAVPPPASSSRLHRRSWSSTTLYVPLVLRTLWRSRVGRTTLSTGRRSSEADSRPTLGGPLTEDVALRFSDAVLSIARRALQYTTQRDAVATNKAPKPSTSSGMDVNHVVISMQSTTRDANNSAVEDDVINDDPCDHASVLLSRDAAVAFPDELLAVVWMHVASLDGYCGQTLLHAAESGSHDRLRAWLASLLAWGSRVARPQRSNCSCEPFVRQGIAIVPVTVATVHARLQALVEQFPAVTFDFDIGFLVELVAFVYDTLARRWQQLDDEEVAKTTGTLSSVALDRRVIETRDAQLGSLLPLQCGHNKNYRPCEKRALVSYLHHVGFLDASTRSTPAAAVAVKPPPLRT